MKYWLKITLIVLLVVGIVAGMVCCSLSDGCGSSDKKYTCNICNREFKGGTDDSWSIIRSNMCKRCKKNLDWASGN